MRSSSSVDGLGTAARQVVWTSNLGNVWAPELVRDPLTGRFYIFFVPGAGDQKRMFVIESASPDGGYGSPGPAILQNACASACETKSPQFLSSPERL